MRQRPAVCTLAFVLTFAGASAAQSSAPAAGAPETAPLTHPALPAQTPSAAAVTDAPTPSLAEPRHRHDQRGRFYSNFLVGLGHLDANGTEGTTQVRMSGTGATLSVAMGATVVPNLVVYGLIGSHQVTAPTVEANGRSAKVDDMKMSQFWLGPGVAYYFMPINLLVGASVMASATSLRSERSPNLEASTKLGPAFGLRIGKEWWIAQRIALGVTAEGVWASMPDEGANAGTLKGRSLSVGASLSYN